MSKYPFFKYITGDSKIHLMNSKLKILWFLLTFLAIILINDFISMEVILLFLSFIVLCSKINITAYVVNIFKIWYFYVFIAVIMFLISFDLSLVILSLSKIILTLLLFLILTFTTSLSEIAWGLECLFLKLKKIKVPVSKISLKIAMNIKFISTVFEQSSEIRKSMAYRGIPYSKNKLASFKKMFIPVLSLSYKLSKRTVKAMKLRFYGSSKRRTNYHENKVTKYDRTLIFCSIIIIYIVIWLGWC